jgi:N-acetylglutamate synthase-like GNAT family acetyltransferase
VLVALDGGSVVGFTTSEPAPEGVELTALMVEPRWGRRGHGSRLLQASVEHWSAYELAVSWVFEADTVLSGFLESAGWAFDGLGRGLDTGARVVPQRRMHTDLRSG